jgi:glycosyltransferase involved in cell wall biosynthesis
MASEAQSPHGILALFPFLVKSSLPVAVMREMRARGHDVTVARYLSVANGYTMDPLEDFAAENRLIDLSSHLGPSGTDRLEEIVLERGIELVLQIGAPWAYPQLSRLKERLPALRLVDTLYNTSVHFHSFSLYGGCFDAVLVESQKMASLLHGGPHGANVRQVENGVNLTHFIPAGRATRAPEANIVLGYVGRMSPEKNPLGFVTLAEQLHATLPALRFIMFGQGPMDDEVRARITSSPAKAAIRFAGFVDPTTALAEIDVLVVPSVLDGRPAAVMEANACGVPVIGAPVGGIPELIEEERNGLLAGPGDHVRIAAKIASWRAEPESFTALRRSARQVAEARFDRVRMMDRYEAVYRDVLARPARPLAGLT